MTSPSHNNNATHDLICEIANNTYDAMTRLSVAIMWLEHTEQRLCPPYLAVARAKMLARATQGKMEASHLVAVIFAELPFVNVDGLAERAECVAGHAALRAKHITPVLMRWEKRVVYTTRRLEQFPLGGLWK